MAYTFSINYTNDASGKASIPPPHAPHLSPGGGGGGGGGALSHAASHSGVSNGMFLLTLLITGHYAWW